MNPMFPLNQRYRSRHPYYWYSKNIPPPFFHMPHHMPADSYFPDFSPPIKRQENQVKVEENSENYAIILEEKKKKSKIGNRHKKQSQNNELYLSPVLYEQKPRVNHSVTYFDPSAAPTITSILYNQVIDCDKDLQNFAQMNAKLYSQMNELQYEEKDDNPFIQYRHRRIKKKYKKHLAIKDPEYYKQNLNDESDKDNSDSSPVSNEIEQENSMSGQQKINSKKSIPIKPERKRKTLYHNQFSIFTAFDLNLTYVTPDKK